MKARKMNFRNLLKIRMGLPLYRLCWHLFNLNRKGMKKGHNPSFKIKRHHERFAPFHSNGGLTLPLKQKDTMKGYTISFKMESISIHNYLFINFPTISHMNEIDREKMQQHDVNTENI